MCVTKEELLGYCAEQYKEAAEIKECEESVNSLTDEQLKDIIYKQCNGDLRYIDCVAFAKYFRLKFKDSVNTLPNGSEVFDFVTETEIDRFIKSGNSKTPISIGIKGSGSNSDLSPCCISTFYPADNDTKEILELIACFNEKTTERRVFNEVHMNSSDPYLTLGFGHFADVNSGQIFIDMKAEARKAFDDLIDYTCLCLQNNKIYYCGEWVVNPNKYKSYMMQFWEDYNDNVLSNEKILDENNKSKRLEDAVKLYFTRFYSEKELPGEEKKYRYLINKGSKASYISGTKKVWGDGGELKVSKLLARFAMKDAYVRKHQQQNRLKIANGQAPIDISQFDDEKFKTGDKSIKSLKELRELLEALPTDKISKTDVTDALGNHIKFDKLLELFNTGIKEFNNISKEGAVATHSDYAKITGDDVFCQFTGTLDICGYWLYDILRKALCLRKVCFYQLRYWIDHFVLDDKIKLSAGIAAIASVSSSRYHTPVYDKVYVSENDFIEFARMSSYIDNTKYGKIIDELSKGNVTDTQKAILCWYNYSIRVVCKDGKNRGRQEQIWYRWFKSMGNLPNLKKDDKNNNLQILIDLLSSTKSLTENTINKAKLLKHVNDNLD